MTPPLPEISVVVPVCNEERYVEDSVHSIVNTAYPRLDIVVIDDGSTDRTPKILETLARRYSSVRVIRQSRRGVSASRNRGIVEATGEYICFIDGDDMMLPNRFESAQKLLTDDETLDGVVDAVAVEFQSEVDKRAWGAAPLVFGCTGRVEPDGFLRATLLERRCQVLTPSALVRRRFFEKAGVYDEGRSRSEDFHLWLRMAACGRFGVGTSPRPVAVYRRHGANTWTPNVADSVVDLEVVKAVMTWARRNPWVPRGNVAVLEEAFRNKFYHCMSILRARADRLGSLRLAAFGVKGDSSLVGEKRFWGNVWRGIYRT